MKRQMKSFLAMALLFGVPVNVLATETVETISEKPKSILLEDFEGDISDWIVSGAKYKGEITQTSEQVRFGNNALKISYDFTGQTGTSGVYAGTNSPIAIEGHPKKIGMWVYGDGKGLWLRGELLDAENQKVNLDFTDSDPNGATWQGWKYVEAEVSTSDAYKAPFKLNLAARYMSTVDATKIASAIYVDNIRAVYEDDPAEDTMNPTFGALTVTENTNKPTLTLQVSDNVEIDGQKFAMKINGETVTATFDAEKQQLIYQVQQPLAEGKHTVWAEIFDTSGNSTFKLIDFTINSGGPLLTLQSSGTPLAGANYLVQFNLQQAALASGIEATFKYNVDLATALDQDNSIEGVQLDIPETLQPFVKENIVDVDSGTITLKLDAVPAEAWQNGTVATLQLKMATSAAGHLVLALKDGKLTYMDSTIGTLPFQLNDFTTLIEQPLKATISGKSVGTETVIRVVDTAGQPVEGASLKVLNAPVLIQTTKETIIYKGGSGVQGEPHETIPAGTFLFTTNQPTEKFPFYRVYMPDGQTRYFHVASTDAEKKDLHSLIPVSDANGEIRTSLLTLTRLSLQYQIVKDELVSEVASLTTLPQHGTEKIENVFLSIGNDSGTTMDISWKTGTNVNSGVVQYVEATDKALFTSEHVKEVTATTTLLSAATGELNTHQAELKDLKPGMTYHYRVGDTKGQWTEERTFTTATQDEKFEFLFATDTQASNTNDFKIWTQLVDKGLEQFGQSQFILHGGDIVDDGDDFAEWQAFLNASSVTAKLPFMAVMGNHEAYGTGEHTFKSFFNYTSNSPQGKDGFAYSFDYKNARFIMLNTEFGANDMAEQAEWVKQMTTTAGDKWTIVVMHRSPYSSNPLGGGSEAAAAAFTPVIEAANVDLVLTGHDHSYMRTKPMKDGKVAENGDGTTYIIGGSAGPKFYPEETNDYTAHLYGEDLQVISNIAIDGDKLTVQAININGEKVDEITLAKRIKVHPTPEIVPAPVPVPSTPSTPEIVPAPVPVPSTPEVVPGPMPSLPSTPVLTNDLSNVVELSNADIQQNIITNTPIQFQDANVFIPASLSTLFNEDGQTKLQATITDDSIEIAMELQGTALDYVTKPITVQITHTGILEKLTNGHILLMETIDGFKSVPYKVSNNEVTIYVHQLGKLVVKEPNVTFKDIDSVLNAEEIRVLASRGIIKGTSAQTFMPNSVVSRGEFATMISRALGIKPTSTTPFSDISTSWFKDDVTALHEVGIIQGKPDGTFAGSETVTRQQAALIIYRILMQAGIELPNAQNLTYTDSSSIADYAIEAISVLQQLNIMVDIENGQFNPNGTLTRAQIAKVLTDTLQVIGYM